MRSHRRFAWLAPIAGVLALAVVVWCQAGADAGPAPRVNARHLIYPAKPEEVPKSIRPYVDKLLAAEQGPVAAADARPMGVFTRVLTRKYILDGRALKRDATLGSTPFVFTTLPEALYGRTLLQVFSTLGYSADDVLASPSGENKVAVIFRWEESVTTYPGRGGDLPANWHSAVYPATWDNLFALMEKMAGDRDWHYFKKAAEPPIPTKLQLRSPKESQFLLGFPDAGKQRIKASSYYALREIKGADWEYRQLLERSMSAAEHFAGDGTSKPTIGQGKAPAGFPEFIGPNRKVSALPEIAVIDLGALRIAEQ